MKSQVWFDGVMWRVVRDVLAKFLEARARKRCHVLGNGSGHICGLTFSGRCAR
jgi:hypothetical protein